MGLRQILHDRCGAYEYSRFYAAAGALVPSRSANRRIARRPNCRKRPIKAGLAATHRSPIAARDRDEPPCLGLAAVGGEFREVTPRTCTFPAAQESHVTALKELRGKIAVVTGGASGMGKGMARQLSACGMQVIIADVEEGVLMESAREIGAVGIHVDVSDYESVRKLADEARRRFGTVHVICNNAGIGPMARIAELTIDDWRWMMGVNLWGVIHGVTAFLPILRSNGDGGHIVNTASIGGLVTMSGLGAYSVTKYGVVALSETLAQELEEEHSSVGVTVLCPGPTRTNIKTSTRTRPPQLGKGSREAIYTPSRTRSNLGSLRGASGRYSKLAE
jgi:NAD(P)-dependent dehydrogenase (short-subunit alcohol dehydrogenase family)